MCGMTLGYLSARLSGPDLPNTQQRLLITSHSAASEADDVHAVIHAFRIVSRPTGQETVLFVQVIKPVFAVPGWGTKASSPRCTPQRGPRPPRRRVCRRGARCRTTRAAQQDLRTLPLPRCSRGPRSYPWGPTDHTRSTPLPLHLSPPTQHWLAR